MSGLPASRRPAKRASWIKLAAVKLRTLVYNARRLAAVLNLTKGGTGDVFEMIGRLP